MASVTVRDVANWILDLAWWQGLILLFMCAFAGGFAYAAAADFRRWRGPPPP